MGSSLEPLIQNGGSDYTVLVPEVWSGMNRQTIQKDPSKGCYISKTFGGPSVYATTVAQDGIYPFLDTSDTINGSALLGGGLKFTTAATDNNSPTIQWGGTTGSMFSLSKATPKDLAFQFNFRVGTIIETGVLFGLGAEGMAANDGCLVDDTGAMADKDFLGFRGAMHASVLTISATYKKNGQTEVVALTSALVPAINTWYSLAVRYSGFTKLGQWWVNGFKAKELDFSNTATVPTATCPFDTTLSPVICLKAGAAAVKSLIVRDVEVFQKF